MDEVRDPVEHRKATILAVDDNHEALFALEQMLRDRGYEVITASSGKETLRIVAQQKPDLVLLDVMMPDMSGLDVTRALKGDRDLRLTPVVLLTANDTLEDVLEGIARGADDYIRKPFRSDELVARIAAALRTRDLYDELASSAETNRRLQQTVESQTHFKNIIGKSAIMCRVFEVLERVKSSQVPVLITGSSGTGKELVAKAIHFNSPRKHRPFIVQNCSALQESLLESELFGHSKGAFTGAIRDKEGLFEAADGGTFFLDELGEMSPALQVKLLRVLQDGTFTPVGSTQQRKVDVRIIAATHRNLEAMIREGKFREDLFYRLNVLNIQLPTLAERREDIPLLVEHFLSRCAERDGTPKKKLAAETLMLLVEHSWPGNIRELENEVDRLVVLSGDAEVISPAVVSASIRQTTSLGRPPAQGISNGDVSLEGKTLKQAIEDLEREMIGRALLRTKGNRSEAARELGISRSNLLSKIQEYHL